MKVLLIPENFLTDGDLYFEKISPSLFTTFQKRCILQNILIKADKITRQERDDNDSYILPISLNAIWGTIIHKMFELRSNGMIKSSDNFNEYWDNQIFKEEEKLIQQNDNLKHGFLVNHFKRLQTMKLVLSMPIFKENKDYDKFTKKLNLNKTSEVDIWDVDYLHGSIDKIVFLHTGIEIIDYKSGQIFTDDENEYIKEDYIMQLKLYALLFEKKFKIEVKALSIIDSMGIKIPVVFQHEELDLLYAQVQKLIIEINQKISEHNWDGLYKTDMKQCPTCQSRSVCSYYWNGGITIEHDIQGTLKKVFNNGVLEVEIPDKSLVRVKDIYHYSKDELELIIGKRIRIMNVYFSKEVISLKIYVAKEWTRIFCIN